MSREEKKRFHYKKASGETMTKRARQSGGMYDTPLLSDLPVFKPKEGDHRIRVLPQNNAEYFGMDIYQHWSVGADGNTYLCAKKMKGEDCPMCEEVERAQREGEDEYAKELRAGKRVLAWVIDRDDEKAGPQLWPMPFSVDKEIANLSVDKRTQEILHVDDPEEGYDVEFTIEGSKKKTKYTSVKIARKPTPLADDEETANDWLDYVMEHPLAECLQWFDYDYIAQVFAGGKGKKSKSDDDEDEEEGKTRSERRRVRDDDDDAPKAKRGKKRDDDDDDDDDDDEPPKKGKKARDEDDELDEDDEPAPKKGKKRDDDDDDDDDDDEDEPPKKPKAKSRDDDDDDDDDEPAPKKGKAKSKSDDDDDDDDEPAPKKGKRTRVRDDDEDEDDEDEPPKKGKRDDDEDDDDDDDEPAPKKKGFKDKLREGLKGKKGDDDDDDDDEPAPKKGKKRDDDEDDD